jgi:hypothetical protein
MNTAIPTQRLLIAGAALALAACAAAPQPPNDALQAADIALTNADSEHAADAAPLEMRTAREKLSAAHSSAQQPTEESVMKARRLAEEARADADLALAKSHLAKSQAANQEIQKSGDTLRQEIQRGPGA